jgi:hypothetical protein
MINGLVRAFADDPVSLTTSSVALLLVENDVSPT